MEAIWYMEGCCQGGMEEGGLGWFPGLGLCLLLDHAERGPSFIHHQGLLPPPLSTSLPIHTPTDGLLLPDTSRLGICSLHKNTSGNTLCQMPIKVTKVKTSENFVSHSNLTLCWHFVQIIEISPRNSCSSILASQMAASVN